MIMTNVIAIKRPRGRPRKDDDEINVIRENLIRAGVVALTEKGFASTGLDEILKSVGVPKGSFYYYFENKETFGLALIDNYAQYFQKRLDRCYQNNSITPLECIAKFMIDSQSSMARYDYRRGCLIGNLGQEMAVLPDSYRQKLIDVFRSWQKQTADCLRRAIQAGELSPEINCDEMAEVFWTGWEGAVLRAKLEKTSKPLQFFGTFFLNSLRK